MRSFDKCHLKQGLLGTLALSNIICISLKSFPIPSIAVIPLDCIKATGWAEKADSRVSSSMVPDSPMTLFVFTWWTLQCGFCCPCGYKCQTNLQIFFGKIAVKLENRANITHTISEKLEDRGHLNGLVFGVKKCTKSRRAWNNDKNKGERRKKWKSESDF